MRRGCELGSLIFMGGSWKTHQLLLMLVLLEGFVVTEVLLLLTVCWFHDRIVDLCRDYFSPFVYQVTSE